MPVRWLVENVPLIDEVVETLMETEGGSCSGTDDGHDDADKFSLRIASEGRFVST